VICLNLGHRAVIVGYTLEALAALVDGQVSGDQHCIVGNVASIESAREGDICFFNDIKLRKNLLTCQASAVIVKQMDVEYCPGNALVVADPYVSYAKIAALLTQTEPEPARVDSLAVVDPSCQIAKTAIIHAHCVIERNVRIGERVHLGPGCFVGEGSVIGDDTWIAPNVTLYHDVIIGERGIIHAGVVLGSDGFGLANDKGRWIKVPQLGKVCVGDDVEIGANCAIDRGTLEDTVIADGVKIDNLVHIAHNVKVGAHSAIAGCVGVAGSSTIGAHCTFGGMAGVAGHVHIADNAHFTGMAMVTKSITEPGIYSSGLPAEPNRRWRKNVVRFRQLEKLENRLRQLEDQLKNTKG